MTSADRSPTAEIIAAIRDWLGQVQLVPEELAPYAPLVIDGLLFFLERLPAERLEAIVIDQAALAADATPDERLVTLLRRSPTLHKLGQVVAREPGLPRDLRLRLQGLESLSPGPESGAIGAFVERELGAVPGLILADRALAEGSVAIVIPFEWDAPADLPRRGVFKALKPRAEAELLEDLAIWPALGDFLEAHALPDASGALPFRTTLEGVAELLRSEIRLDREQERLDWAHRFYADSPRVRIPRLLPFCTAQLTAMERIDGGKITDSPADAVTRRGFARTLIEALLAKPFWSPPSSDVVFHADPHAGNLFACADGRVAIFDWALTTRLRAEELTAVVQTLAAAATLDERGVCAAVAQLGTVARESDLRAEVAAAVAQVRRGAFPGFNWLTHLLDELGRGGIVIFPEPTALFRKFLLTLSGVVRDVAPQLSIDEILICGGGRQLAAESMLRAFAPPGSRAFGTHVSNVDLWTFLNSAAWTPARYLLGAYAEFFAARRPGVNAPTPR